MNQPSIHQLNRAPNRDGHAAYLVGTELSLADLHGVCGLAPAMALLPFSFPKVEAWPPGGPTVESWWVADW